MSVAYLFMSAGGISRPRKMSIRPIMLACNAQGVKQVAMTDDLNNQGTAGPGKS